MPLNILCDDVLARNSPSLETWGQQERLLGRVIYEGLTQSKIRCLMMYKLCDPMILDEVRFA